MTKYRFVSTVFVAAAALCLSGANLITGHAAATPYRLRDAFAYVIGAAASVVTAARPLQVLAAWAFLTPVLAVQIASAYLQIMHRRLSTTTPSWRIHGTNL